MWNACGCTCIEGNAVNYEIIPRNSIKTTSSLSATPFSEQHLVSAAYPRMFLNDSSLYKWIISIGTSSRLHGKLTFLVGQLQLPTRLWQEVSATYMVNKVTERCKLYSSKWWTTTSWDSGAYTYQWRAFLASKTLCGLFHPVFVKSWPASTKDDLNELAEETSKWEDNPGILHLKKRGLQETDWSSVDYIKY